MRKHTRKNHGGRKLLSVLTVMMVLMLAATGAYAAKQKATTIRLAKTEGDVTIKNSSKGELTQSKDMRLYSGDHQITGKESYAWMSLDDTKAAKLDESSESELRKKGRKLEVLLDSGNIFFNVTVPLDKDESLNIRTSTMVAGIRGTCGWFEVRDDWATRVWLLTGSLDCLVTNPIDGNSSTNTIKPGTYSDFLVFPKGNAEGGETTRIETGSFSKEDIPGFVLVELVGDDELIQKIYDESGIDLRGLTKEEAEQKLKEDQKENEKEQDKIEDDAADEQNIIAKEPVWPDEGDGGRSGIVYLIMPQKAQTVQDFLDHAEVKKVVLLPGKGSEEENTLWVDIAFDVPASKTLEARKDVVVNVNEKNSFLVDGTAHLKDNLVNYGTVTVRSANTLRVEGRFLNNGKLENTKSGRVILSQGMETSGEFINSGVIEPADGTSGDALISVSGGLFSMLDGRISAKNYNTIIAISEGADATLNLAGGVIANDLEDAATIRAKAGDFYVSALGTDVAGITDTLLGKDINYEEYGAGSVYRTDQMYHLIALDSVDSYPVILGRFVHGTVIVPGRVEVGAKVTAEPIPDKGYHLESISVNYYYGEGKPLGEAVAMAADHSFVMPSHNVIITATFVENESDVVVTEPAYKVNFARITGGKVTANVSEAKAGDEVVLSVSANTGFELESLSVADENGNAIGLREKGNGYAFTMPEADVTVRATFRALQYNVVFYDEDGRTVLNQQTLAYGTVPVYAGATPTKAATNEYTYAFGGWKYGTNQYAVGTSLPTVTKDMVFVAYYNATAVSSVQPPKPTTYTVTWTNWDGSVLEQDTGLSAGAIPHYDGSEPERPADAQYTYYYEGWKNGNNTYGPNDTLPAITGNVTYVAFYVEVVNTYTVTWVNEDGNVLETDLDVPYGEMPEYNGETPAKPSTAQYDYAFSGWTPAVVAVAGDVTYTAAYSSTVRTYTVTWMDDDGLMLEADDNVEYGATPSYSTTPTKPGDAQYSYTFAGWSDGTNVYDGTTTPFPAVTGDVTYTATYTQTLNRYTVTWLDDDDTLLGTAEYDYGDVPSYGSTPTKEPTAQYTYTFSAWSSGGTIHNMANGQTLPPVTGDVTYKAVYTYVLNSYTVTWIDGDGNVIGTDTFNYGVTPSFTGAAAPGKTETQQYAYTFAGWSETADGTALATLPAVTGSVTYYAVFTATLKSYAINFYQMDANGNAGLLDTQTVAYGDVPVYGGAAPVMASTAQYEYTFAGWSDTAGGTVLASLPEVTDTADYYAVFTQELREYDVTFYEDDGTTVIKTVKTKYGEAPVFGSADPTKASTAEFDFTFAGWRHEMDAAALYVTNNLPAITGDTYFVAQFTSTTRIYHVTWLNADGSLLYEADVAYGISPAYNGPYPEMPEDAQYTYSFISWSWTHPDTGMVMYGSNYPTVSGDFVITAYYNITLRSYLVKWYDGDGSLLEEDPNVDYGTTPSYDGSVPTKASTAQYEYVFKGWTDGTNDYVTNPQGSDVAVALPTVNGPMNFTAIFYENVRSYTINFYDGLGSTTAPTLLESHDVEYGEVPEYTGTTPTKAPTTQYEYVFAGWTDSTTGTTPLTALPAVIGAANYYALFTEQTRHYDVTFYDDDRTTVLKTVSTEYGTSPVYGSDAPTKESTAEFDYLFNVWENEDNSAAYGMGRLPLIYGETSFYARYSATTRSYVVTFNNYDGTQLDSQTFAYGQIPSFGGEATPAKPEDETYTYSFAGWSDGTTTYLVGAALPAVTGDVTYTAEYGNTFKEYTVTWQNYDGSILETDTGAHYGDALSYDGETPAKPQTTESTFVFDGWSDRTTTYHLTDALPTVNGDMTLVANFAEEPRKYTVSFYLNPNSTPLYTNEFEYNATPTYGGETPTMAATTEYVFTFDGWSDADGSFYDGDLPAVAGDASYYAHFAQTTRTGHAITARYFTGGGSVSVPERAASGDTVTITVMPKTGYSVTGVSTNYVTLEDGGKMPIEVSHSEEVTMTGNEGSFIMPDSDVTVEISLVDTSGTTYQVTVGDCDNGVINTLSTTSFIAPGTIVDLSATPDSDYEFQYLTVTYPDGSPVDMISDSSFYMPESNVIANAYFSRLYGISYAYTSENSNSIYGDTSVAAGKEASFYVYTYYYTNPTSNGAVYRNESLSVKDEDGNDVPYEADHGSGSVVYYKFTMPEKNVTIDGTFGTYYKIVLKQGEHGTATVDKEYAKYMEEVTITVTPDAGYGLWTAYCATYRVQKETTDITSRFIDQGDGTYKYTFQNKASSNVPSEGTVFSFDYATRFEGNMSITGTPQVGETLMANVTTSAEGNLYYVWKRHQETYDVTLASGIDLTTYVLTEADAGYNVECRVTCNGYGGYLSDNVDVAPLATAHAVHVYFMEPGGSNWVESTSLASAAMTVDGNAATSVHNGEEGMIRVTTSSGKYYVYSLYVFSDADGYSGSELNDIADGFGGGSYVSSEYDSNEVSFTDDIEEDEDYYNTYYVFVRLAEYVEILPSYLEDGGTVTVSVDHGNGYEDTVYAKEGEAVRLTVTPNAGYSIGETYYTSGSAKNVLTVSGGYCEFSVPYDTGEDVTVYVEFVNDAGTEYDIHVSGTHGSATTTVTSSTSVSPMTVTKAKGGRVVTIVPAPDAGYGLSAVTVTGADGTAITVNEDNTFIMPEQEVTIAITFVRVYTLSSNHDNDRDNACSVEFYLVNGNNYKRIYQSVPGETIIMRVQTDARADSLKPDGSSLNVAELYVTDADGSLIPTTFVSAGGFDNYEYYEELYNEYSFTMPASDVYAKVIAGEEKTINVAGMTYGDVTSYVGGNEKDSAVPGQTVTLEVTPQSGYYCTELKVEDWKGTMVLTVSPVTQSTYEFTMPGEGVNVSAKFAAVSASTVSLTGQTNGAAYGTVTISAATANVGSSITVTATPAGTGYYLAKLEARYAKAGGGYTSETVYEAADVTSVVKTFTLTAANVDTTYYATFASTAGYALTTSASSNLSAEQGGTITLNVNVAAAGDTVTATVTPATGFSVKSVYALYEVPILTADGTDTGLKKTSRVELTAAGANQYTFTMPDDVGISGLTVYAEFENTGKKLTLQPVTGGQIEATNDQGTSLDNVLSGSVVTIAITPGANLVVDETTLKAVDTATGATSYALTKVDDTHWTFTMPDAEVTVSAGLKAATANASVTVTMPQTYGDIQNYLNMDGVEKVTIDPNADEAKNTFTVSGTLTIPAVKTLNISEGVTVALENGAQILNLSDQTIHNYGTIFIGSGSTLQNGDEENAGRLVNEETGLILVDDGASLLNTNGEIENDGTIQYEEGATVSGVENAEEIKSLGQTGDVYYRVTDSTQYSNKYAVEIFGSGVTADYGYPDYSPFVTDYKTSLAEVIVGEGVAKIGDSLFEDCTGLKVITLPESLQIIGERAFYNTDVTELVLPKGCSKYGYGAFQECTSLASLTLPDRIEVSDEYSADSLFYGCTRITAISFPETFNVITSGMFDRTGITTVTIPGTVKEIGGYAFGSCGSLKNVVIEEGVETIGRMAFYNDYNVTSVTLADTITEMGDGVFYKCTNLMSAHIPDGMQYIAKDTFYGCTSLTSVDYGDNVQAIQGEAFYNCSSLQSFDLDTGIQTIGYSAFYGCNKLNNVVIGSNVTEIESSAFLSCTSLSNLTIRSEVLRTIGDSAFAGCKFSAITLPESVTEIGSSVFYGCGSLKQFTMPSAVTVVPNGMFKSCTSLTKVTLAEGTTEIGGEAFYECSALTEVNLPDTLKTIGGYAFYKTKLASLQIPEGVETISYYAFAYCTSLVRVTLPDSATELGDYVFQNCISLENVTLPGGLTYIPNYMFYECSKLNFPEMPESLTAIGTYAFKGCYAFTDITIPASVTTINGSAFAYSSYLTTVRFADVDGNLKTIGSYAFTNCVKLANVYYAGTQEQWEAISIGSSNECLTNAVITFNSIGAPESESGRGLVEEVAAEATPEDVIDGAQENSETAEESEASEMMEETGEEIEASEVAEETGETSEEAGEEAQECAEAEDGAGEETGAATEESENASEKAAEAESEEEDKEDEEEAGESEESEEAED